MAEIILYKISSTRQRVPVASTITNSFRFVAFFDIFLFGVYLFLSFFLSFLLEFLIKYINNTILAEIAGIFVLATAFWWNADFTCSAVLTRRRITAILQ